MDPFEIDSVLKSFRVIIDTREHNTSALRERCAVFGTTYENAVLDYGDYAANITLPNGSSLHEINTRIRPQTTVERKQSIDELATCFTRERSRFRREFERASANNAKVYLLIENGSWEGIMRHRYRSRFHPEAFKASLTAWMIRYDFTPVFCRAETSGAMIKEILYRDMKERLERGEYG